MHQRDSNHTITPAAAFACWLAVVITLSAVGSPYVVGVVAASMIVLALRFRRYRLVAIGLCAAVAFLLLEPMLNLMFATKVSHSSSPAGYLIYLRICAHIVAVSILLLPSSTAMVQSMSRLSANAGLLIALVARSSAVLLQDARSLRLALQLRGFRFDRRAPIMRRLASTRQLLHALLAGSFDRASTTASVLATRGFAMNRNPTVENGVSCSSGNNRILIIISSLLVGVIVAGRVIGELHAPTFGLPNERDLQVSRATVIVGVLTCVMTLLLLRATMTTARQSVLAPAHNVVPPLRPAVQRVHIRSLDVTYPQASRAALSIPALDFEAGQVHVLTGASGSGKSTLIQTLNGVTPYLSGGSVRGSISVGTQRIIRLPARLRSQWIATVHQVPDSQIVCGTVFEEVALALRNQGVPYPTIVVCVEQALTSLGILHLAHRQSATLSGGELQRVMLAAAFASNAPVLLLDEPTAHLDAAGAQAFWTGVQQFRELGSTVIVADHDWSHASGNAATVTHFVDGQLQGCNQNVSFERITADSMHELNGASYLPPIAGSAPVRISVSGLAIVTPTASDDSYARRLIDNLNFDLPSGSVLAVTGDNGVGKSLLLKGLIGVGRASGCVVIDGAIVDSPETACGRIAYVTQDSMAWALDSSIGSYADAGLGHVAGKHPNDISVGERQRLAIVTAIRDQQPAWIFDEPTRGMDARAKLWLTRLLEQHRINGGIAIVATHDQHIINNVATHLLQIDGYGGCQLVQRTVVVPGKVPV